MGYLIFGGVLWLVLSVLGILLMAGAPVRWTAGDQLGIIGITGGLSLVVTLGIAGIANILF